MKQGICFLIGEYVALFLPSSYKQFQIKFQEFESRILFPISRIWSPLLKNLRAVISESKQIKRMNGLEFLDAIKRDPQLCLIPVVVLTTSDNTNDLLESYKLNASGYLLKSLDYEQFTNTISSLRNYWAHNQLAY